jgi:CRP-like cAMP-binding protein
VKDHLKNNKLVKQLIQGEYFGELALLNQCQRTATVKSTNYCTMASFDKKMFYDMCNKFSDIFIKMKMKAVSYRDPWKMFKIKLLNQIDYFNNVPN